ncbi:DNA adenine methylase [Paenibacillus sp. WLX2291]|uniref:DNA adenine methylase n=1 Tax=Paenibacillus sp. WLX2291 TaxID=3296934 RepID=UPI0039844A07
MSTTKSPLRYPGGKTQLASYVKDIIELNFDDKPTYIEPFSGGAGVAISLLLDDIVKNIVINDYDKAIYYMWYSLLYNTEDFIKLIQDTPISLEEWHNQKNVQNNFSNHNILEIGYSTFFLNRTNHSGIINAGPIGGKNQTGKYKLDCRFNKFNLIKKITKIATEKERIKLHNLDALELIELYLNNHNNTEGKNIFTFFDPPYYKKGPELYTNFYNHEDHLLLSKAINALDDHKWIVTYDICEEIKQMYTTVNGYEYALNYSLSKRSKASEFIFFSKQTQIPNFNKIKLVNFS